MDQQGEAKGNAQIIYISHGGGPLPILGDASHAGMVEFMKKLPSRLHKPDGIMVISAHWEEEISTLLSAEKPAMFYDYYGFPEEAYRIQYSAPGNPELARQASNLLKKADIPAQLDPQRGFDHGLFIPLKLIYPQEDIPSIQLSLIKGLNAQRHIDLGKALRGLKASNILLIGSGFSFHNLGEFFPANSNSSDAANDEFQDWLIETCTGDLSLEERERRLIHWRTAPSARYCHPREEHLLPLHVCFGAAAQKAKLIFDDYIAGKRAVAFLW
jgi:4,5-DOPA dioxygenase extradiol